MLEKRHWMSDKRSNEKMKNLQKTGSFAALYLVFILLRQSLSALLN